jgi:hypothetical protein
MPSLISPPAASPSSTSNAASQCRPTLPPPQTFDFIPPLHDLLSRLLVDSNDSSRQPLTPRDLAIEAGGIKAKIQEARAAIAVLPDVDRNLDEQDAEMKLLEESIRAKRDILKGWGERAGASDNETAMGQ